METKKVINVRGNDCLPEAEEKFNKWLEETHIPMLLETGELQKATRYRRIGDDANFPKYLAIYEFEDRAAFKRYEASQALAAAVADAKSTWAKGGNLPKWRVQYEVISTFEK